MKHKPVVITLAILMGLSLVTFGVVHAQQAAPSAPAAKTASCPCMQGRMQGGMMPGGMGQGMMSMQPGMMGTHQGMMGMCPMMLSGVKVGVKSLDKGATISITSEDAKTARRIQLMAEMMRLMHELRSEQ